MNIQLIADRLNSMAIEGKYQIAGLPGWRKKHLGKKRVPKVIFTKNSIKSDYAFHHGGRSEWQFNFGAYDASMPNLTRFALCLSVESSISLQNPVWQLKPYKDRFNECLKEHPKYFEGMKMWYFQSDKKIAESDKPFEIADDIFKNGCFIVVGYYLEKKYQDLNDNDLAIILQGFDKLLPIYKYCVLENSLPTSNENRIAKICWNENDWMSPSGNYGKSADSKSHEKDKGYGHEEWLFDFDKLIDGYHYALLQPAQQGRTTFLGKKYDVRLFSHNSETKENFWIGEICDLEVLSIEEAQVAYSYFLDCGWIDQMENDIRLNGGNYKHFRTLKPHECFNIRFKPENAKLLKPYQKIENFKEQIGTHHYQFIKDKTGGVKIGGENAEYRVFKFKSGKSEKSLEKRTSVRISKVIQSEPTHDRIQDILYANLINTYGKDNVGMETDTGIGTKIDISVNGPEGIILYEVKSYPSIMITLRIALGQLLEYAYYPNPINKIEKLIIVSHMPIAPIDRQYIEHLRKITTLPLFYQSVNIKNGTISELS